MDNAFIAAQAVVSGPMTAIATIVIGLRVIAGPLARWR